MLLCKTERECVREGERGGWGGRGRERERKREREREGEGEREQEGESERERASGGRSRTSVEQYGRLRSGSSIRRVSTEHRIGRA
eukprot:309050-Rhodomonas_salina.2